MSREIEKVNDAVAVNVMGYARGTRQSFSLCAKPPSAPSGNIGGGVRRLLWHPIVYAINFVLIPYNVARDFDSPPKPRWMKWISIETQIFGEPDLKEPQP